MDETIKTGLALGLFWIALFALHMFTTSYPRRRPHRRNRFRRDRFDDDGSQMSIDTQADLRNPYSVPDTAAFNYREEYDRRPRSVIKERLPQRTRPDRERMEPLNGSRPDARDRASTTTQDSWLVPALRVMRYNRVSNILS